MKYVRVPWRHSSPANAWNYVDAHGDRIADPGKRGSPCGRVLWQRDLPASVAAELLDDSRISITFVTIQSKHDAWVKAFFEEGKGTTYSGIWLSDGDVLPAIPLEIPRRD